MVDLRLMPEDDDEDESRFRDMLIDVTDLTLDEAVALQTQKRRRSWAKVYHRPGIELALKAKSKWTWVVLLALDHAIFEAKTNPVRFTNSLLKEYGVARETKWRVLRELEAAGVVRVTRDGRRAPWAELLWPR
jgi:hypothetical protein